MARRKSLKKNKSNSQFVFLVFGLLILISLLYTVLFLKTTRNTINLQAQSKGCTCDPYKFKCFNGSNAIESYAGKGANNLLYCCFGPYNDKLYNEFSTSKLNYPHFETVADSSCSKTVSAKNPPVVTTNNSVGNNCLLLNCNKLEGLNLVSTKKVRQITTNGVTKYYRDDAGANSCSGDPIGVVSYCSFSCNPITLNYGNCINKTLWQKINENYDPAKDNAKYLGYYKDNNCLQKYDLSLCRPPLTPTPSVVGKKVNLTNPNSFELTMISGIVGKSDQGDVITNELKDFGLNTFHVGGKYTLDLTNNPYCQKDPFDQSSKYALTLTYRKSGVWYMMSAKNYKYEIPCEQDNFNVDISLKL